MKIPAAFENEKDMRLKIPAAFENEKDLRLKIPVAFENEKDMRLKIPAVFENEKDLILKIPAAFGKVMQICTVANFLEVQRISSIISKVSSAKLKNKNHMRPHTRYDLQNLFRTARVGIFPRSSLLGAGQVGLWEFGRGGSTG